jgi:hypothetical protein
MEVAEQAVRWHKAKQLTMVMEDDARIAPDFFYQFKQFMNEVPDDWDALWLGYYPAGLRPYTALWSGKLRPLPPHVGIPRYCYGMHCYVIREPMLRAWVTALQQTKVAVDATLNSMLWRYKVYVPQPASLVIQAAGHSDVTGKFRHNVKAGD